jgi:mono/diheme cytochrome c family protein
MLRSALALLAAASACAVVAACQTPRIDTQADVQHTPQGAPAAVRNDPNEFAFGRRVARRLCAECHALDPGQASPLADAPPFPVLYQRFPVERLDQEVEAGMMVGHPRMPLLRHLDEDEAAALVAYLSHFRRDAAGAAPR